MAFLNREMPAVDVSEFVESDGVETATTINPDYLYQKIEGLACLIDPELDRGECATYLAMVDLSVSEYSELDESDPERQSFIEARKQRYLSLAPAQTSPPPSPKQE